MNNISSLYLQKTIFRIFSFFLLVVLLVASRPSSSFEKKSAPANLVPSNKTQQFSSLPVDEVGELLMFGLPSAELDTKTVQHLKATCPGSILLFKRNIKSLAQVQRLIDQLKTLHSSCSKSPLFIALDQEGGTVSRVAFDPPLPSAWAVGQTNDPELARMLGRELGYQLAGLGFNMNLAPVLDLGKKHSFSFISSRAYGDNADAVSEITTQYSLGLIESRILPVAKHFPGIGSGSSDPHWQVVRRSIDLNTLLNVDLIPFKKYSELFPVAIMPSHLVYPKIDSSLKPATFSQAILTDLLRTQLKFKGLVVSDDLQMRGAAAPAKKITHLTVDALNAGIDISMISWSQADQAKVSQHLITLSKNNRSFRLLLANKISRIRKIKHTLLPNETKTQLRSLASFSKTSNQPEAFDAVQNFSEMNSCCVTSLKYSGLLLQILKKNVNAAIKNLSEFRRPQRVFIWPSDHRMRWQLERTLNIPVFGANSKEFKSVHSRDLILSFIKRRSQLALLKSWPLKIKKQTFLINQVGPDVVGTDFAANLPIFMEHPQVGHEVARALGQYW